MKAITKIKIRGYHIDSYGHVNNTRYLEFLEEARWNIKDNISFFKTIENEYGLVVVNNTIDYLAPSFINDELTIESAIKQIGNKSIVFQHEIFNIEKSLKILTAKATFVYFNRIKNQSEQIPEELRKNLSELYCE